MTRLEEQGCLGGMNVWNVYVCMIVGGLRASCTRFGSFCRDVNKVQRSVEDDNKDILRYGRNISPNLILENYYIGKTLGPPFGWFYGL